MTLKEQTDLLGWKDITTSRQKRNGTIIYRLPIKKYGQFIEVGSFESGYVRRMNGGDRIYQLNKCENYDHYYKEYKSYYDKDGDYTAKPTGKYNKMICRKRILIPNEVDRLEYLISYCLKNYYINQANMIEDGKFIPKWKHEYEMKNGSMDRVRELQDEIRRMKDYNYDKIEGLNQEIDELSDKYTDICNKFESTAMELDELTVSVNGNRYKVI